MVCKTSGNLIYVLNLADKAAVLSVAKMGDQSSILSLKEVNRMKIYPLNKTKLK